MKDDIKEIYIDNEKIYLKKSKIFGWGVVFPIKENNKINWKNLIAGGSWIKTAGLAIIIFLIYLATKEYSTTLNIANECLNQTPFIIR